MRFAKCLAAKTTNAPAAKPSHDPDIEVRFAKGCAPVFQRNALAAILSLGLSVMPGFASGGQIAFDGQWKEQRLSVFGSNDFDLNGSELGVVSDGTVSLLWKRLPQTMWNRQVASWEWAVDRSVPPTDLTRKGGDDRNLSLYFVFLPEEAAREALGKGVKSLLDNPDVRVLMYVWGGAHERGDVLPSPYLGSRGRSVIRRGAGVGTATERVDLARDHKRAFGEAPQKLVGVAVSADSDDTDTSISARIKRLRLE